RVQKLIDEGLVSVNGEARKANYRVHEGECISVNVPAVKASSLDAENIDLEILFEDSDVLVLNKPKGLVVHPAAGHRGGTAWRGAGHAV
ncbi:MAG: hypothetical protein CVU24_17700, partial [Betaproteobacteria bacterium HGW-Betaproteobacteria-18]